MILEQLLFALVLLAAILVIRNRILHIRRNIRMGRSSDLSGPRSERIRNMLLVAFGQKKMFKRPVPALLHFFVYAGFLIINIEVLEFMIDGLAGTHRIFSSPLGSTYPVLMNIFEFLAFAVLVSCVVFLIRRNILRLRRFWSAEMKSWPRLDANIILVTEILLMIAILSMNAADQVLQSRAAEHYTPTGKLFFSSLLMPLFDPLPTTNLILIERFAWWFHIIGILGFAVYVTYSKHLHIAMAFPNTYFAPLEPRGKMSNIPVIAQEVRSMLGLGEASSGEAGRFGARDVPDLTWKSIMDAYTCTECGRCTSECPANLTGKKLSPRKIMMDVRDRAEEIGQLRISNKSDEKALLGDYITKEEINACTSCNACVEACPVMINPLTIILDLRRYVALEESGTPPAWNAMFQNIESNFAPWKFPPTDRFGWANEYRRTNGEG